MTAYLLADHLLNFVAPALAVAVLLVLLSRVFARFLLPKRSVAQSIRVRAAMNIVALFILNVAVLAAGLVLFGNDGKMATYAGMVVAAAFGQWLLGRSWQA